MFPKLEAINLNGNDQVSPEMLKVLQEKLNIEVCLYVSTLVFLTLLLLCMKRIDT